MGEFLILSNSGNSFINLQIIRNFSLLIPNISNKQHLYYIFSNNFINQIISNFDSTKRKNDNEEEDFLSYYVNFIKSISIKLDQSTIQFFFHTQANSFPLLDNTLLLYNYPDQMIRNVSRSIILSLIKMNYAPVIDYMCSLPQVTYFFFVAKHLCETITFLIESNKSNDEVEVIKDINDDIINDIIFIQDVFRVGNKKINYIFTNCLFSILIIPFLCGNIVKGKHVEITLFIIWEFFLYMKDENFINLLSFVLYNETLPNKVNELCVNGDKFNGKVYLKNSIVNLAFDDYIKFNFNDDFFNSLLYLRNSPYKEVNSIQESYNAKYKDKDDKDILNYIFIELEKKLNKKGVIEKIAKYHTYISNVTGIRYGLSYNGQKNSFLQLINKMFSGKLKENKKERNIIKEKIIGLFNNEASNEKYIFLYNLLILYHIEIGNKAISKELLHFLNYGTLPYSKRDSDIKTPKDNKHSNNSNNNDNINIASFENLKINSIDSSNIIKSSKILSFNIFFSYRDEYAKKNNLDEYYSIAFPNEYFSSLSNDSNSNINSINKTKNNMSLLIVIFFSFLGTDTLFMITLCLKIILALIFQMQIKDKEKFTKMIKEGYYNTICKIKNFLNKEKENPSNDIYKFSFEFFQGEFQFFKTSLESIIPNLSKDPFFIDSNNSGHIVPKYFIFPICENNMFKYFIYKFFCFYDLKQFIEGKTPLLSNSESPLTFPGMQINLQTEINLKTLQIEEYHEVTYKEGEEEKIYEYCIFFYKNALFFSEKKEGKEGNSDILIVKKKFALRRVESCVDQANNQKINVYILGKRGFRQIIVRCKEEGKSHIINKWIWNMKKNAVSFEFNLISSYFTNMITEFQREHPEKEKQK